MVEVGDRLGAIGGGEVTRDELVAAKRAGKDVHFIAADMNHAIARERTCSSEGNRCRPTLRRGGRGVRERTPRTCPVITR